MNNRSTKIQEIKELINVVKEQDKEYRTGSSGSEPQDSARGPVFRPVSGRSAGEGGSSTKK